jgi:paraquat-inducible protein B
MPFSDIGKALLSALKGVADTVHDPDIQKTLRRLPEVETTLQGALTNANKAILSFDTGYGNNSQFNRDVERLMAQLNDATRSIRALADLLARNPEALVKGRAKGAQE